MAVGDEISIEIERGDGTPLVRVSGDVDLTSAPALIDALTAIADEGHREVRLDLSAVTFLDSAGIGALVRLLREGVRPIITKASHTVDRALELAGISELLGRSS